ncbi:MAG: hypothetical protein DCC68_03160 [Planctomycetota bacterium]|nr:MAG: hypothetical protein DCC68_03160 [Planctomycetota bacterium]
MRKRLKLTRKKELGLESLELRTVLQGIGIGNPFDGIPEPPFETPPVDAPPAPPTNGRPVIVHPLGGPGRPDTTPPDPQVPPFGEPAPSALIVEVPPAPPEVIPPVDLPDQVPDDVPPAPPTNGRPVIVHPLGGPGRPDTTPPDPQVPPFGEPAPSALIVEVPPAPPEVIPPVELPDQVPDDVPPAPPTNGRPVIVHPLGGPGRPETTPPTPVVPPFGEPAPSAVVMRASRTASASSLSPRAVRARGAVDPVAVDAIHSQTSDGSALSAARNTTARRSQSR